jgi:hypothetical protein
MADGPAQPFPVVVEVQLVKIFEPVVILGEYKKGVALFGPFLPLEIHQFHEPIADPGLRPVAGKEEYCRKAEKKSGGGEGPPEFSSPPLPPVTKKYMMAHVVASGYSIALRAAISKRFPLY